MGRVFGGDPWSKVMDEFADESSYEAGHLFIDVFGIGGLWAAR